MSINLSSESGSSRLAGNHVLIIIEKTSAEFDLSNCNGADSAAPSEAKGREAIYMGPEAFLAAVEDLIRPRENPYPLLRNALTAVSGSSGKSVV